MTIAETPGISGSDDAPVRRRRRKRRRRRLPRFRGINSRGVAMFALVLLLAFLLGIVTFELGKSLVTPSAPCLEDCPPGASLDP